MLIVHSDYTIFASGEVIHEEPEEVGKIFYERGTKTSSFMCLKIEYLGVEINFWTKQKVVASSSTVLQTESVFDHSDIDKLYRHGMYAMGWIEFEVSLLEEVKKHLSRLVSKTWVPA